MTECQVPPLERYPSSRESGTQMWSSKLLNFNGLTVLSFSLQEVIYEEDNLYLIFEYCEYDLKKYMRSLGGPLPMETVKKFTYQIL